MDLDDDELRATRKMNGADKTEDYRTKIITKIELLEKLKSKVSPCDLDTIYKNAYYTGGIDALTEIL